MTAKADEKSENQENAVIAAELDAITAGGNGDAPEDDDGDEDGDADEKDDGEAPEKAGKAAAVAPPEPSPEVVEKKRLVAMFRQIGLFNKPSTKWWAKRCDDFSKGIPEGVCPTPFTGEPDGDAIVARMGGGLISLTADNPLNPSKGAKWSSPVPFIGEIKGLPTLAEATKQATTAPPVAPVAEVPPEHKNLVMTWDTARGCKVWVDKDELAMQHERELEKSRTPKTDPVKEALAAQQAAFEKRMDALAMQVSALAKVVANPPPPSIPTSNPVETFLAQMLAAQREETKAANVRSDALVAMLVETRNTPPPAPVVAAQSNGLDQFKSIVEIWEKMKGGDKSDIDKASMLVEAVNGLRSDAKEALSSRPVQKILNGIADRVTAEFAADDNPSNSAPRVTVTQAPPPALPAPATDDEAEKEAIKVGVKAFLAPIGKALDGTVPVETAAKSVKEVLPDLPSRLVKEIEAMRTSDDLVRLLNRLSGSITLIFFSSDFKALAAKCATEPGKTNATAFVSALNG
jgi:hypothetical protein